jgi:hypothetical protein
MIKHEIISIKLFQSIADGAPARSSDNNVHNHVRIKENNTYNNLATLYSVIVSVVWEVKEVNQHIFF